MARIGRCVTHARAIEASKGESDLKGEASASASAAADEAAKRLLDHLEDSQSFVGAAGRQVFSLPPAPKSLPCHPFLLDTAIDHIVYVTCSSLLSPLAITTPLSLSLSVFQSRSHHLWKCQILGEKTPAVTDE